MRASASRRQELGPRSELFAWLARRLRERATFTGCRKFGALVSGIRSQSASSSPRSSSQRASTSGSRTSPVRLVKLTSRAPLAKRPQPARADGRGADSGRGRRAKKRSARSGSGLLLERRLPARMAIHHTRGLKCRPNGCCSRALRCWRSPAAATRNHRHRKPPSPRPPCRTRPSPRPLKRRRRPHRNG